jgi:hypothetical protein
LECLRQTDIELLQEINLSTGASGFVGTFVWIPVIDGTFIEQQPTEALKEHKVNVVGCYLNTRPNPF